MGDPRSPFRPADEQRWSYVGVRTTLICFLLNMMDGVNVFALTYVAPGLQKLFHANSEQFSLAFSAGLAGMALGGVVLAPQADRFGRRPILLLALALMGGAMIFSAAAADVLQLSLARFAVGVGIGTLLASLSALSAGFAPDRYRNLAVGLPQAGYPVGAMIAGFLTAWALPLIGWRVVFEAAGGATLCLIPLCALCLPEAPDTAGGGKYSILEAVGGARAGTSALLWVCTICGFMALYFIASWITKLAIQAGLPQTQAIIASAFYNGGAVVGTVLLSVLAVRIDIRRALAAMLVLACALLLVFGGFRMPVSGVLLVSFLIGVTLQGGVNSIYPVAAGAYPPQARATGLGWAMGVGRLGAVMGPLVGGWALGRGLPLVAIFGIFCAPLLVTALAANGVQPFRAEPTAA